MKRKNTDETNAFFEAIYLNDLKNLEQLLTLNPGLINELNSSGSNALSYAISQRRYNAEKY